MNKKETQEKSINKQTHRERTNPEKKEKRHNINITGTLKVHVESGASCDVHTTGALVVQWM